MRRNFLSILDIVKIKIMVVIYLTLNNFASIFLFKDFIFCPESALSQPKFDSYQFTTAYAQKNWFESHIFFIVTNLEYHFSHHFSEIQFRFNYQIDFKGWNAKTCFPYGITKYCSLIWFSFIAMYFDHFLHKYLLHSLSFVFHTNARRLNRTNEDKGKEKIIC